MAHVCRREQAVSVDESVGGLSKETWAARPPLWLCLFLHSRSPTYVGVGM